MLKHHHKGKFYLYIKIKLTHNPIKYFIKSQSTTKKDTQTFT